VDTLSTRSARKNAQNGSVAKETDASAPRSGARRLARGTRFLRTPGTHEPRIAPRQGCEEAATPFQGADSRVVGVFQGYAKNAYPWLISQHRFAVRGRS